MLSISPETPLFISTRDVDNNGSVDPLIFNAQQNSSEIGICILLSFGII